MQESPQVVVNGELRGLEAAPPHENLLDWLRGLGLTGAKEGCAEGECGACAVLVARADGEGKTRWTSVNSCLPPAVSFDGQEVVTSEGLGRAATPLKAEELHPVQQEMVDKAGSQCGYCTPGFICSMAAEYYRPERCTADHADDADTDTGATDHEVGPNGFDLHALSGNLCRCTGYRPIRDAAYALGTPDSDDPLQRRLEESCPQIPTTTSRTGASEFHRPGSLEDLLDRYAQQPDAVLMAGATDLGVESNIRHSRPSAVFAIDHLSALRTLETHEDYIEIGAALPLSDLERRLDGAVPLLAKLFPQFASRLIRNSATFGGNLGTGSPIGDSAPALLALDASVVLASVEGEREVPLAQYFTGYRQTVRKEGELIRAIRFPLPLTSHTAFHKIAKRRFDDISSVAVGIAINVDQGQITQARIGLGGVAATPIRATATEQALIGQPFSEQTVNQAAAIMGDEGTPMDDHRASSRYRAAMLQQSLPRFFAQNQPTQLQEDAR